MKKIDALLKKVEFFERLAVYGDRKAFLQAIAQEVTPLSNTGPASEKYLQDLEPKTQTVPEMTVSAFPPIDRRVQSMLNDLLVPEGDILPLAIDGEKGPRTQKALEAFMKRFNKPGTPEAVAQVFKAQKAGGQSVAQKPDAGAPVAPMGPGLPGIGNTKSTGIGEQAGAVPRPNVAPKT